MGIFSVIKKLEEERNTLYEENVILRILNTSLIEETNNLKKSQDKKEFTIINVERDKADVIYLNGWRQREKYDYFLINQQTKENSLLNLCKEIIKNVPERADEIINSKLSLSKVRQLLFGGIFFVYPLEVGDHIIVKKYGKKRKGLYIKEKDLI